MQEIGIAETREHVNALNERLIAGVDELGGTVVTPRDGRAARRARLHPLDRCAALVAALGADGIVTSERDGNLRISAHAYNIEEDIDAVSPRCAPSSAACGTTSLTESDSCLTRPDARGSRPAFVGTV